jgi:hypothetical protein
VASEAQASVEPLHPVERIEELADRIGRPTVVEVERDPSEQVVTGNQQPVFALEQANVRGRVARRLVHRPGAQAGVDLDAGQQVAVWFDHLRDPRRQVLDLLLVASQCSFRPPIRDRAGCEMWMHPNHAHATKSASDPQAALARRLEVGRQSGVPIGPNGRSGRGCRREASPDRAPDRPGPATARAASSCPVRGSPCRPGRCRRRPLSPRRCHAAHRARAVAAAAATGPGGRAPLVPGPADHSCNGTIFCALRWPPPPR